LIAASPAASGSARPGEAPFLPVPVTAAAAAAPAPNAAQAPQGSVSVHIEQGAEGARAWLGVRADAALGATRGEALCAELRRALQAAHQRLAVVVCNGQTIYSAPATGAGKELS
jgi:DNA-binding transcriptional regulator YdaS (Cro superfamily)